jgi:hypothetical protein
MEVDDPLHTSRDDSVPNTNPFLKEMNNFRRRSAVQPILLDQREPTRPAGPMKPVPANIASFLRDAKRLVAQIDTPAVCQVLLQSMESTFTSVIKQVYFMAQVNVFKRDFSLESMQYQDTIEIGSVGGFEVIEQFSDRYNIASFTELIRQEVIALQQTTYVTEDIQSFFKAKDHLEAVRVELWQQYAHRSDELLSRFFSRVKQQYNVLLSEYKAVLTEAVARCPTVDESLVAIFKSAFSKDPDWKVVNEVIRDPNGLRFQTQTVTKDGPVLLCHYLKDKDICEGIKIDPGLLKELQPVFHYFATIYAEFYNKLFQISTTEHLLFTREFNELRVRFSHNIEKINEYQQTLNSGLLQTDCSTSFVRYIENLQSVYLTGLVRLLISAKKKQQQFIQTF